MAVPSTVFSARVWLMAVPAAATCMAGVVAGGQLRGPRPGGGVGGTLELGFYRLNVTVIDRQRDQRDHRHDEDNGVNQHHAGPRRQRLRLNQS